MKRLCAQIVQHLTPGGIERLALDLAHDPVIGDGGLLVSLEGDRKTAIANWPALATLNDRVVFLGKRPGFDPTLPTRLACLLVRRNVAWTHTHHMGPLLYGGLASRLKPATRWVHSEHDSWHLAHPSQASLTRRCLNLLRPRVTSVARHVGEGIIKHTGWQNITVVPNGVDTERFCPGESQSARLALGLPLEGRIIGVAGRLEPVKNQTLALHALAKLGDPAVKLAIAGTGSQREALESLTAELGLGGQVIFLGHVEHMVDFYRAINVFGLPSISEGLPLSLLEAQACGTPAVATDVGGSTEALCPKTGQAVASGDADGLARSFAAAMHQNASLLARRFVLEHGSLDAMRQAYRGLMS